MSRIFISAIIGITLLAVVGTAKAGPIIWVHDSSANLATVDVAAGNVSIVGNMGVTMTDIAFDPDGNLFGISFADLYSIDSSDGSATFIGAHGIATGNALVFGTDGTLYGAGAATTNLFTINVGTGTGTIAFDMGFASSGDLAFNGGSFFLAEINDNLVEIDLVGLTAASIGAFGFNSVFGLATAENGILYGVAGTEVFTVDTATGAGTFLSNYTGQGLTASFGSSFFGEAGAEIPEPGTLAIFCFGLLGLGLARRCRKTV